MKKSFKYAIATLACASALLAGCTSNKSNADGGNNKAQASGDFKVEVIAKGFQHDFWKAVNKGAEKAAQELGAKITFVGPQNETATRRTIGTIKQSDNRNVFRLCLFNRI